MTRRTARRSATALLLGTAGLVATMAFGSSAALAAVTDDDDSGIGMTVTVTPAPTAPAATSPAPSSPRGPSSPSRPVADVVAPPADKPVAAEDEVDLGGILFVSGLSSVYDWSINPLDGAAETSFTVRNVSKSTFTSSVRFWADGPIGNQLGEVDNVEVADLKPGETRTIETSLEGIGQSTFVRVHATLTPPKTVDGVELDSITREQFVVIPPWGIAAVGGIGALGFAGVSLAQFVRRPTFRIRLGGLPA